MIWKSRKILLKSLAYLVEYMGYLDSPKKVPEGVVYIDILNELVEQKIVLVEHCNSQVFI